MLPDSPKLLGLKQAAWDLRSNPSPLSFVEVPNLLLKHNMLVLSFLICSRQCPKAIPDARTRGLFLGKVGQSPHFLPLPFLFFTFCLREAKCEVV